MLTPAELRRYNRHLILPEFGLAGQEKLKQAKVLVVGAGGLGCPVLQYLTAAGVGTLGIADFDVVSESNLQRQILYGTADVGQPKAEIARQRLSQLNPFGEFRVHRERLNPKNVLDRIAPYDIIVDGTDNFPTRYLLNDACVLLDKPLVSGAIFKFEGQVSVFNYRGGPTYRCLFPTPPSPGEVPNCSQVGVIGVLPGIIGSLQANEVIKLITQTGEILTGRLLLLDTLTLQSRTLKFKRKDSYADLALLEDYGIFCGEGPEEAEPATSISAEGLAARLAQEPALQLLDVREPHEYAICHLPGSKLIPLGLVGERLGELDRQRPVVVYCHHGGRSAAAIRLLQEQGFPELLNLEGGIDAWAAEVDPKMDRY
jgi:molybdopterin/thiamine biosynthesis adenylyltransferase/rhodanese-related sulfurtransferase